MYKLFILFVTFLLLYACNFEEKKHNDTLSSPKTSFVKKVERRWFEEIKKDSSNILFIVLDPHGDALLAKNIFKNICNSLNISMISPYTVKNNSTDYVKQIDLCIKQYPQKKKQVYLVGFSGGARMAFQYTIQHYNNIKGLIMCGAGIGKSMKRPLPFPLVMIAGKNDFNMIEQYYSPFDTKILKNTNLISLLFNGKHEWPNTSILKTATEFILSKSSTRTFNEKTIWKDYQESINNKEWLESYKYLELIYKNKPNTPRINTELKQILLNKSFQEYIKQFENTLQIEQKRNQILAQNLYNRDWKYWENKLKEIDKVISNKNTLESESYARTKAFLGLAVYSLCQREIQNTKSLHIRKLLKIYETLEPNNEEMLKMNFFINQ